MNGHLKAVIRKNCSLAIGIILCILPLIVNKWTLERWFPLYVGVNLSTRGVLLLLIGSIFCLAEGIRLIRGGVLYLHEKYAFGVFFAAVLFPYALFLILSRDFANTADLVYGELLTFIPFSLLILWSPRIGLIALFLVQSVVCFVEFYYIHYYGAMPGVSFLYVLLETNPEEAGDFFNEYVLSAAILLFAAVWVVLLFLQIEFCRRLDKHIIRRFTFILLILLLLPMALPNTRRFGLRGNFFVKCALSYHDYRQVHEESRIAMQSAMEHTKPVHFSIERPQKEVHVLIIGESADRDHMSLYGYGVGTTPLLEAMRPQLYVFNNVICPFINTIPNLQALLTFQNYEFPQRAMKEGTLTSYLKMAGYRTAWISNQMPLGLYETLTTIMARSCDETFFVNKNQSTNQASFDEDIFKPLEQTLANGDSRQFIIIHLMGMHTPFRFRYPDKYNIFHERNYGKNERQQGLINRYHNAMRYNDMVVTRIIEMVKAQNKYASVIYLSDHGLELFETRDFHGHSIEGGLEVPFLVWLSDAYKAARPEKAFQLSSCLDRRYMMDDTIYSIFDLLGMEFEGYDGGRSLFSPEFRPRQRIVHWFDYSNRGIDYDAAKRK